MRKNIYYKCLDNRLISQSYNWIITKLLYGYIFSIMNRRLTTANDGDGILQKYLNV